MLQNETVAYLKKHNWISFEKRVNKSQSNSRLRNQIRKAFSDLSLLASSLPDDKQKEYFNLNTIRELFYAMERFHLGGNHYQERKPDFGLAEFLVEYGLNILINEYEKYEKYSPAISSLTIEHLQRTKLICRDIARSIEYSQRQYEFNKYKQDYLFSWNDIEKHSQRVYDFIREMIGKTQVYSTALEFVDFDWLYVDKNNYNGKITDPPDENAFLGDLHIQLMYEPKASTTKRYLLINLELINDIKLTEKLQVKEVGDDLLFFKKKI